MRVPAANQPRRRAAGAVRIGLALAGGGPLGAIYEIGALLALDEALEGADLDALDVYVGVSSGGFIAASLANGIDIATVYHSFIESNANADSLTPEVFMRPALREFRARALDTPHSLLEALQRWLTHPQERGALESLANLSRSLPAGIFDNDAIAAHLSRLFAAHGGTDDFRRLRHRLYLVATDLDSAEAVRFGAPGYDHVPISRAVEASAALPGLYPPVEIDGRCYVDGALIKTLHASVALECGAKLVICVNPLVPYDAKLAARRGRARHARLVDGGLPVVMAQTFRALIHSRMQVGMSKYDIQYPDADVLLFEPARDDAEMFFTNVFSYAGRRRVCEHAYQHTRADLLSRRAVLAPLLARHGMRLRIDVLRDPHRHAAGRLRGPAGADETSAALAHALDRIERWLKTVR